MFKKLCLLTTSLVLVGGGTVWAEDPTPYNCDFSPSCEVSPGIYGAMGSPVMSKFKMSIGGYVKMDYAHNSNAAGPRLTGPPTYVTGGTPSKDESVITPKQSRVWLKVAGPTFMGAKTNALVEIDFYGGSFAGGASNESSLARMRHAYGTIDWTNTQILFGQFWDMWGPATADTIDFFQGGTSGTPNTPRVPQIRLTQKLDFNKDNGLKLIVGVQNPQQDANVQATDFPSANAPTNAFGSVPSIVGQFYFTSKMLGTSPGFMGLGMAPLQLGVFGEYSKQKFNAPATTPGISTQAEPFGYGAYAFVPLVKSADGKGRAMTLSLEAQVYQARGENVQTSNALALYNATPGQERLSEGFGYYGQLKFYPTQDLGLTAGYEQRHATNMGSATTAIDFPAAGNLERYNSLAYANATYDINAAIRLATEYEFNSTSRVTAAANPNYARNNVIRLAAYYFF